MKLANIATLFLLFTTSCVTPRPVFRIAPDLQPYVAEFYHEAADRERVLPTRPLYVEFADLGERGALGVCIDLYGVKLVQIDPEFWAWAPETYRVALIAHELGHCVLDREHDETSCFMHAYTFPAAITRGCWDELFKEEL